MSQDYDDGRISVTPEGLQIRFYYFPAGTKRIPFDRIRSVTKVNMGAITGRARIWGTANPGVWAPLDPKRPRKKIAFLVSTGGPVSAYLTPDDPQAFEQALAKHGQVSATHGGRSPIV